MPGNKPQQRPQPREESASKQVSAVRGLLDELAGKLDARSAVQDELFAEIKKTQESVSQLNIELNKFVAEFKAQYEAMGSDIASLKAYRENFWPKVIGCTAAISTLIASVAAGLAVLMR